jgi:hypothetical protein
MARTSCPEGESTRKRLDVSLVLRGTLYCVNRRLEPPEYCPALFEQPLLGVWQNIRLEAEKVGWSFLRLPNRSVHFFNHEVDLCPRCTAALNALASDVRAARLCELDKLARTAP